MKKTNYLFFSFLCMAFIASAQLTPIDTGVHTPMDVYVHPNGDVYVVEGGDGKNDACVTLLTHDGKKHIVIKDLPSVFDTLTNEVICPWRVIPAKNGQLAVLVGGNSHLGPLFGRLLFFDISNHHPDKDSPLGIEDTTQSFDIAGFSLTTSDNKESNPFSAVQDLNEDWYVTDAAANHIVKVTRLGKKMSVFATFARRPNPLFPGLGGPTIDPVPTGIALLPKYDGFLVTTLTGFPFLSGMAGVYHVSYSGHITPYITGQTMLTDIQIDQKRNIYVNQFGRFALPGGFQFGSGQILKLGFGKTDTIAKNYGPGQGFGFNASGKLVISSLFTRQILSTQLPTGNVISPQLETRSKDQIDIMLYPNPAVDYIQLQIPESMRADKAVISIHDATGRSVRKMDFLPGISNLNIPVYNLSNGIYLLNIETNKFNTIKKFQIERP